MTKDLRYLMYKDLRYLMYLAVKHTEVDIDAIVRFKEESGYVYPKDIDYVIEEIYVWDSVHEEFEFRITRPDNTLPVMPNDHTRMHKYTVVHERHLDFINFVATISGTEIKLTFEEMKQLMLDYHPKFEIYREPKVERTIQ